MIDRKELVMDIMTNASDVIQMTITHLPTGLVVRGVGKGSRYKLEQELMEDLEQKIKCKWR